LIPRGVTLDPPGIIPDPPGAYLIPKVILILPKFLDDSGRFPYAPRRDTSPQREAYYLEG